MLIAQLSDYTRSHQGVHLERVNFVVCKLHLNKKDRFAYLRCNLKFTTATHIKHFQIDLIIVVQNMGAIIKTNSGQD